MEFGAAPSGDVSARQGQDRVENQDAEESDREESEGAKPMVRYDAVVNLQQKYRQGQRKQIDRDGCGQHIGIFVQRTREFEAAAQ